MVLYIYERKKKITCSTRSVIFRTKLRWAFFVIPQGIIVDKKDRRRFYIFFLSERWPSEFRPKHVWNVYTGTYGWQVSRRASENNAFITFIFVTVSGLCVIRCGLYLKEKKCRWFFFCFVIRLSTQMQAWTDPTDSLGQSLSITKD